jgi:hypothetical protein
VTVASRDERASRPGSQGLVLLVQGSSQILALLADTTRPAKQLLEGLSPPAPDNCAVMTARR